MDMRHSFKPFSLNWTHYEPTYYKHQQWLTKNPFPPRPQPHQFHQVFEFSFFLLFQDCSEMYEIAYLVWGHSIATWTRRDRRWSVESPYWVMGTFPKGRLYVKWSQLSSRGSGVGGQNWVKFGPRRCWPSVGYGFCLVLGFVFVLFQLNFHFSSYHFLDS